MSYKALNEKVQNNYSSESKLEIKFETIYIYKFNMVLAV